MRCIHAGCTKRLKVTHKMYVTGGMNIERPPIGDDMILPMRDFGVMRILPASALATGAIARMRDMRYWKYRKVVNTASPSTISQSSMPCSNLINNMKNCKLAEQKNIQRYKLT